MSRVSLTVAAVGLALIVAGCSTAPVDHEYVTDYRIVGDKTVKYLYLPGEASRAGGRYRDEAVALEICSVQLEEDGDEAQEGDEPRGQAFIEADCETTRLLRTEEYR